MKTRALLACLAAVAVAWLVGGASRGNAAEFTVEETEHGATIQIDGELFANYVIDQGHKPFIWPIIGPTGQPMTRAYPMAEGPHERKDHPHHKSFWFTHGDVNGVSYWHMGDDAGHIVHREFRALEGGERAVIATVNDWVNPEGEKVMEDQRRVVCWAEGDKRYIDFDITLTAGKESVRFGDTKEGTFGIRVAGTMKVTEELGGRIVNSEGHTDAEAWGKKAAWVDYTGPVADETVGIAILNHPDSFRYPTYWHVRTYGLFAANPFGWSDFVGSRDVDGSYTLSPRNAIHLYYRVVFHKGDSEAADIEGEFARYAELDK